MEKLGKNLDGDLIRLLRTVNKMYMGNPHLRGAGEKIAMMAFGKETIFAMKSSIETRIQKEAKAISDKRVSEELELMNRNRTDKIESTGAERKPNEAEKVLQRTQSFLGSNTSQFKNKNQ